MRWCASRRLPVQMPGHPLERNQELLQLHLKGQGHPAGVAAPSQLLCRGPRSPVTQPHLSAVPTAGTEDCARAIKKMQKSACKYLPRQVFPAVQKETRHLLCRAAAFLGPGLGEGH